MKFLLLASLIPAALAGEITVLTDDNFRATAIDSKKPVFTKFYAPWCGHCKALAPTWEKVAEKASCTIADLDATVHRNAGGEMKVRGYPTLILFADNLMYEYQGGRTEDELAAFCDNYKEKSSGKALPWNVGYVEVFVERAQDYGRTVMQILNFAPSVLPVFFFVGMLFGIFLMWLLGGSIDEESEAPAPASAFTKKEEKKSD